MPARYQPWKCQDDNDRGAEIAKENNKRQRNDYGKTTCNRVKVQCAEIVEREHKRHEHNKGGCHAKRSLFNDAAIWEKAAGKRKKGQGEKPCAEREWH